MSQSSRIVMLLPCYSFAANQPPGTMPSASFGPQLPGSHTWMGVPAPMAESTIRHALDREPLGAPWVIREQLAQVDVLHL
jgi:hypothetical protein